MNRFAANAKKALCVVFVLVMTMTAFALPASAKVGQTYASRVQGLRVRKQPGSTEILTKLGKGEKVVHKGTKSGWWLIKTRDGHSGYVFRTYLKSTTEKLVKNGYYKVQNIAALPVRKAPRTAAEKLGSIKRATTVQLKNKRGNWGYVQLANGKKGWVELKYLKFYK